MPNYTYFPGAARTMKTLTKLVEDEVRGLTSGEVLHAPVAKMSMEERLLSHTVVKWMLTNLGEREKELNARLKEDVNQVGVENDKGHKRFEYEGSIATVEKRMAKAPDEDGLKELLTKNGIDPKSIYDEITVLQFNPSKLGQLVDLGKLKQADVDALRKTSYALFTEPSSAIQKQLEALAESYNAEKVAIAGPSAAKLPEGKKPAKKSSAKK